MCAEPGLVRTVGLDSTHAWSTHEKLIDGMAKAHPEVVERYATTWVQDVTETLSRYNGTLWIGCQRMMYGTLRWLWRINKDLDLEDASAEKPNKRGTKRTAKSAESQRPTKKGQAEIDDLVANMESTRKRNAPGSD